MFLKSKWKDVGIKKKIFISSILIITLSFMALYMCIYIFMPRVYENYKMNKIHNSIKQLKQQLELNGNIELNETLEQFSYDNNLDLAVVKKDENNSIQKIIYSSFGHGHKETNKISFEDKMTKGEELESYKDALKPIHIEARFKKGSLNIEEKVYIKMLEGEYTIMAHVAVSPIDEASTIVALFFPFAIIAIIAIALAISIFYSIEISKPLVKINKVAKKMEALDFTNVLEIKGNDEIGQLSSSINFMNKNLKDSFEQLEKVNSKLKKEIEFERSVEKERSEFIGTISHELKSPITIISGQLEGMIYNIGKYKDRDKYLKESYNVVQNMRELVQEILNLSERENVDFKYNFTEVNLSNLVFDVAEGLRYFLEDKGMVLESDIEKDIIVMGDEKLLKKAIGNIIKNGVVHSPKNEKIIIKLKNRILEIKNTGITISKEDINEIFNAFYRTDKSRNRQTGGSGLGLYIVKKILDKHEGFKYYIESKENSVVFKIQF
jgi:two-component system sensor histidine kinase VanS